MLEQPCRTRRTAREEEWIASDKERTRVAFPYHARGGVGIATSGKADMVGIRDAGPSRARTPPPRARIRLGRPAVRPVKARESTGEADRGAGSSRSVRGEGRHHAGDGTGGRLRDSCLAWFVRWDNIGVSREMLRSL